MSIPLDTVVGAALIITLAYTVFGLTGFGSSITAMPFLVMLLPLRMAVPMMLIFDLCAGLLLGLRNRSAIDLRELLRLVPFMLLGMALGVTLLVNAPERVLLFALGVFVLAYSGWSLLLRPRRTLIPTGWAVPLGAVGGVFTALFGTGGPIYTIYLARRIDDTRALRATISSLIVFSGFARLALFSSAGLYEQADLLQLALLLLPCVLLGVFAGSRLHHRLPTQRIVQFVWGILILGGAGLIGRSLVS